MRFSFFYLLVVSILIFQGCKKPFEEKCNCVINDIERARRLINQAEDTVSINGDTLFLDVYAYRNFFPSHNINNSPHELIVTVELCGTKNHELSNEFILKEMFVINSNLIWIPPTVSIVDVNSLNYVRWVAKNGPEWDTGKYVDVILRIFVVASETEKMIIARKQQIHRVE